MLCSTVSAQQRKFAASLVLVRTNCARVRFLRLVLVWHVLVNGGERLLHRHPRGVGCFHLLQRGLVGSLRQLHRCLQTRLQPSRQQQRIGDKQGQVWNSWSLFGRNVCRLDRQCNLALLRVTLFSRSQWILMQSGRKQRARNFRICGCLPWKAFLSSVLWSLRAARACRLIVDVFI